MSEEDNRISLQDNSASSDTSNEMAEGQGTNENATQEVKGGAQKEEGGKEGGSWMSAPENMGNSAGDKIQSAMGPMNNVGGYLGKAAGPVGGLVDGTVGGLMKTGKAFGEQAGVGYGNHEGGPGKQEAAEEERMKESVGGKDQTAENPLGL